MIVKDYMFWQESRSVIMEFDTTTSSKRRRIELPKHELPKIMDRMAATMEKSTAKNYRTQGLVVVGYSAAIMVAIAYGVFCMLMGAFLV